MRTHHVRVRSVGNCRPPNCRSSGVSGRGFPIVAYLMHYCRSPYFNTLWKSAMRHVIRRISGKRSGGGCLLSEVAPPEIALTVLPVCYGMRERERGLRWHNRKEGIWRILRWSVVGYNIHFSNYNLGFGVVEIFMESRLDKSQYKDLESFNRTSQSVF